MAKKAVKSAPKAKSASKKAAPKKAATKKPAPKKAAPAKKAPASKPSKPAKTAAPSKQAPAKGAKPAPAKPAKKAAPAAPPAKAPAPPKGAPAKAPPAKPGALPQQGGGAKQGGGPKQGKGAVTIAARPALAPPPPPAAPAKGKGRKGEPLTLVPARSSSSGLPPTPPRPAAAPPKASKGAAGVTLVRRSTERPGPVVTQAVSLPIPVRKVVAQPTIEERYAEVEKRLAAQPQEFQNDYWARFDKSWIYHDSALEGSVYTLEELSAGLGDQPVVTDSSLQPAADEIRRHKEAIEYVRDAAKKKIPVTIDVIKKIYLILHPSEGDIKTVKYRRDIPQHRLYFHEYAQPDKIGYKVRQVVDWLNDPETKKTRNALRIAARAHYDLLRVFPFQTDSGKVARLFMNLLLMRSGNPPAIVHATERQRYYDALKGEPNIILKIAQESVENSLASVEKLLEDQEARARPPAPPPAAET